MSQKIILVVGGAGFVGSHVNKMLHQAGYSTVVFDNLSRGNQKAVTHGQFVQGDIGNRNELEKVFSSGKFHAVMHFAAFTDVGESTQDPLSYYQNNVANTLNLLDGMLRHKVKFFIFSSSASVYGIPQEKHLKETHSCIPINPYGKSKLMVESILQDCSQAYGIKSCCLRYFNAAGGDPEGEVKNYKAKENNLIPLALRSLLSPAGKITIFGTDYPTPDGTCIRDYIHIHDLGTAHIMGMEKLAAGSDSCIYNLGNGQGYSVREVIRAVEKVTGRHVNILEGSRRQGDPPILVANAKRAETELGWRPAYPELETMIEHAWQALSLKSTAINN